MQEMRQKVSLIKSRPVGAEKTIVNSGNDRLHKGSTDTLYNAVTIEYENDSGISLMMPKNS